MAKLHGRIPKVPYPHLTCLVGLVAFAFAGTARADVTVASEEDPAVQRLAALSVQLRSEDEAQREAASEALSNLETADLPAIRARIARLGRSRPPQNWASDIINRFRRRGQSEDGATDIARGAMAELRREHPAANERLRVGLMAEAALYWRALDRIGTLEARQAVFPIMGFDRGLWMPEARNWVRRRGPELMALAITARSAEGVYARRWGTWAMEELEADDPGQAIPSLDEALLPDVLRAYATIRIQSAMRVIVSYVGSERRAIRLAARWAIERYQGNAIWILRTAHRNLVGELPPREWGWRRISEGLYAHIDGRRMAAVREAYEAGIAAHETGDFAAMRARFEEVLARAPEPSHAEPMAQGYAGLAQHALAAGDLAEARWAYRRALRLGPEHDEAHMWRAELSFVDAQRDAARGVVDAAAYERVVEASPEHAGAGAALEVLEVPAAAPRRASARTRWGVAAAVLLALLGLGLLWHGPRESAEIGLADTLDATLDGVLGPRESLAPLDEADVTLADSTLPG